MSFKPNAAPLALLLAAVSAPAFAQTLPDTRPSVDLGEVIARMARRAGGHHHG